MIVRWEGHYDLVPLDAVERIRERDAAAIVANPTAAATAMQDADDPYRNYVVPDDLIW
jgi:uncharacterized protein YaiL (DUF2058 family)